jgi:3',5'-nucleoside bisphosphate phosphatase
VRGIDLHTHSTRSDGTTTPSQTVALAAEQQLGGIALTDHDTMDGWDEAADACAAHGLRFIPGVELSTELGGRSVHLLGYYVDPRYAPLRTECDRLRSERLRRAEAMVDKLADLGVELSLAEVLARAGDAPVGRPHIAAAMVAAGVVPDLDAAFDGYLEDGGPAYVTKHALAPTDGVSLIRDAGGVAVLAHPGVSTRDAPVDVGLLDQLVSVGLQGVEADHAGHDEPTRNYWRQAARERRLYVTGSSDFHGTRKEMVIGEATTTPGVVDTLEEMAGGRVAAAKKETPW